MAAPYGVGTVTTQQVKDAQGNPVGPPYDAVWKDSGVVEAYFPQPGTPPGNDYKKITGAWNDIAGCVVYPSFEVYYGPGAVFQTRQGSIVTSSGSAVAVA